MSSLSLFIGPNGENKELLLNQIQKSINAHIDSRKLYNNKQPLLFNQDFINDESYIQSAEHLNENTEKLCEYLKSSAHFESFGYQSQMNSDLLVPGIVGHIAGLLYNNNNVSHLGSPKTTLLEHALVIDLIRMVGYDLSNDFISNYYEKDYQDINVLKRVQDIVIPSGHLTSGGSLSNFEACWSSMWVKFIPLSIKNAILQNQFEKSKNIKLEYQGKNKRIVDMNPWELVNIDSDEAVKLPFRIAVNCNLSLGEVYSKFKLYHPSVMGMYDFLLQNQLNPPVIIIPITAHYSFQKAATGLGLGVKNLISIPVDNKGRIILSKLYEQLLICIKNEIPVVSIISVLGSTQEGSVDNIEEILSIRNILRNHFNFYFNIHIDGAYGGYYLSLIRDEFPIENPIDSPTLFNSNNNNTSNSSYNSNHNNHNNHNNNSTNYLEFFEPELILSDYVKKQLSKCKYADTITIDPHKTGYAPYQSGSILYRNSKFKNILSVSRNYIGASTLSLGLESVEGSRGGHSITSAYLNHCICRPNKIGYGRILKKCLLISKLYVVRLLFLSNENDLFTTYQIGFETNLDQVECFKTECFNKDGTFKDIEEICKNEALLQQLSNIGLNLGVVCFNFNFKLLNNNQQLSINKDYNKFIQFNEILMNRFSYINGPENDLIFTGTYFDSNYSVDFLNSIIASIGLLDNLPPLNSNIKIPVLRASIMNPYLYKYLNQTMDILKSNLNLISKSFNN